MTAYKKAIILTGTSIIAALFLWVLISPCTAFAATYEDALKGYWKFDEGSGGTTADSSGTRNGSLSGATWTTGRFGNALHFTGSQYVDLGSDFYINSDGYTISAFVKTLSSESWKNYGGIVEVRQGSGHVMLMSLSEGYSARQGYMNASPVAPGTYDAWHMVTLVSESDSVQKLYVDGSLAQTYNLSAYPQDFSGSLKVGLNSYNWFGFGGSIDEVAIWSRPLAAAEVSSMNVMGVDGTQLLANDLGYDQAQVDQLVGIYGDNGAKTTIGKIEWTYTTASFGEGHNIGDSWSENGKYYIKLGSGYIGEDTTIPEPATVFTILGGLAMAGYRRVFKRNRKV